MSIRNLAMVLILATVAVGGYVFYQQSASGVSTSSAPDAMTIQFGNNSWDALASIELSAAGQDSYSAVPLTDGELGAGSFYAHDILDGRTNCTYDIRVTKLDGSVSLRPGVDLCAATFYHFEDDG